VLAADPAIEQVLRFVGPHTLAALPSSSPFEEAALEPLLILQPRLVNRKHPVIHGSDIMGIVVG
jgi:hypothetical protein